MRQLVFPYLLVIIMLWFTCGENKMVKHQKLSKYFDHVMSLLMAPIIKTVTFRVEFTLPF